MEWRTRLEVVAFLIDTRSRPKPIGWRTRKQNEKWSSRASQRRNERLGPRCDNDSVSSVGVDFVWSSSSSSSSSSPWCMDMDGQASSSSPRAAQSVRPNSSPPDAVVPLFSASCSPDNLAALIHCGSSADALSMHPPTLQTSNRLPRPCALFSRLMVLIRGKYWSLLLCDLYPACSCSIRSASSEVSPPPQPPLDLWPCPCCLANAPTSWFKHPSTRLSRTTHPTQLELVPEMSKQRCTRSQTRPQLSTLDQIQRPNSPPPPAPRTASYPHGLTH
ncbi:hypothetical protein IWX48DRAFT_142191 [Phyllosticta citricarpa]